MEQWHQKLSYSVHHYVEDVIQTSDGDYIVVGGAGGDPLGGHAIKGKAFILRMSEGGGVQWIKRYGIIDTPNNTFWGPKRCCSVYQLSRNVLSIGHHHPQTSLE